MARSPFDFGHAIRVGSLGTLLPEGSRYDPQRFAWVAPDGRMWDDNGNQLGTHDQQAALQALSDSTQDLEREMPSATIDFGQALRELKSGSRVARQGWNGKGMWLSYVTEWNGALGAAPPQGFSRLRPWIGMKTADDGFVPWVASQSDILADDWVVVLG